jgi:COPII coat assembly protein SEC16
MDQLRGLLDRLIGAPHLDKSGSWIGGKMSKPSLDSIGGWLEGRLTKFIAGDGDMSPAPTQESARGDEPGVFTHYSTISSATTSASPSPQPSQINQYTLHSAPPRRSGSAMAAHSSASPYVQIDRASSAMEYSRPDARRASPGPRIASANASTTTFAQSPSFGQAVNGYGPVNGHISNYSNDTISPKASLDTANEEESQPQAATWWGSYNEDSSAPTPTAASFLRVDDPPVSSSSSGFISLMDDASFSVSPSPPVSRREPSSTYEDEDEEDLGFGNSKKPSKGKEEEDSSKKSPEPAQTATFEGPGKQTSFLASMDIHVLPDIKPAQASTASTASTASGSWLGRFWKRAESIPGPIKASLGDETSFYYDKEQKRWVNKKVENLP